MGRPAYTKNQVESRLNAIIHAAESLFAELGYEGVTMRAIGIVTGQSAAAPYRYFESKADIFNAARVAAYRRFRRAQESAALAASDPSDRLARLADAYLQFAIDEPDGYRLMFELKPSDAARTEAVDTATRLAMQPLRTALEKAVDAGAVKGHADQLAHLFWASLHGLASLHLAKKFHGEQDLATLRDPMKTLLAEGCFATSPN